MGLSLHTVKLSEEEIVTAMGALKRQIDFLQSTGEDSSGVREELALAKALREKFSNTGI